MTSLYVHQDTAASAYTAIGTHLQVFFREVGTNSDVFHFARNNDALASRRLSHSFFILCCRLAIHQSMKRALPKSWQECIGTRVGTQVDIRVDTRVDTRLDKGLGTRIHELCHGGESVPRTEQLYTVSACVQARVAS